ncbi:enterochelin esterase family protein [Pararhizobium capsulatum DSM 1112]|uniref:Enterochelin esterase family protein n=1 Tax=Pararhizobium capsulatum DSM 1112 TaxID=1121113 RepID=A0ABU0BUB1_9HYPH|nr:alpha/beta hydrolase family protein [Pararhizobium capsulatum]MDQ0321850.1 enterochelin esterase family protein [Pararhizobium capsulatum DSM 1112]
MHRLKPLLVFLVLLVAPSLSLAGELRDATFKSAALDADLKVNVYIPDGRPPLEGWPVLYLLHGHGGNQNSWRDLGDIRPTLDRMISAHTIKPLVVVMPAAKNSWYVDSGLAGGPGDYETAITTDLRKQIEASLPVRKDRDGRAIAGLSMGGYGALRLAYSHPDLYDSVASLSGAIWHNIPESQFATTPADLKLIHDTMFFHKVNPETILAGIVLPSTGDHFSGSFGTPFNAHIFNDENIFTIVARRVEKGGSLPPTYLTCGDDDGFRLWRGAIALYDMLQANGRTAELRITDGDHVWKLWRTQIVDVLKFIDKQWATGEIVAKQ